VPLCLVAVAEVFLLNLTSTVVISRALLSQSERLYRVQNPHQRRLCKSHTTDFWTERGLQPALPP